jgi:hypothetical protein
VKETPTARARRCRKDRKRATTRAKARAIGSSETRSPTEMTTVMATRFPWAPEMPMPTARKRETASR